MASTNATVTALKTAFVNTQVNQLLSKPLEPSDRALRPPKDDAPLPDRVIRDVTQKLNRRVQEHSRNAWSSIAVRKVAEQIDWIYWNAAEVDEALDDSAQEGLALHKEADLSLDANIQKLPEYIEELEAGDQTQVLDTELARLEDITAQRLKLRKKLHTYNQFLSLLKPFEQPQPTIQPNLAARDGALAAELAKLRSLSIRLAGRLGDAEATYTSLQDTTMEDANELPEDMDAEMSTTTTDQKLSKALAMGLPPN